MHEPLSRSEIAAINATDRNVGADTVADRIVFDAGPQWFPNAARMLLQPKPGLFLHLATDCGERNGHRYTSGEIPVPSYVVRMLLRAKHGRTWLGALMDGCGEDWWHDLQRAEREAARARAFVETFTNP
jgi:hypothetical protein